MESIKKYITPTKNLIHQKQSQKEYTLVGVVSYYCLCTKCCGSNSTGLNAAGKRPVAGISIAASRSIPLGSRVVIAGHHYIVDDRLARKYDSRFDIFMSSHTKAKQFGIKTNKVTIITK